MAARAGAAAIRAIATAPSTTELLSPRQPVTRGARCATTRRAGFTDRLSTSEHSAAGSWPYPTWSAAPGASRCRPCSSWRSPSCRPAGSPYPRAGVDAADAHPDRVQLLGAHRRAVGARERARRVLTETGLTAPGGAAVGAATGGAAGGEAGGDAGGGGPTSTTVQSSGGLTTGHRAAVEDVVAVGHRDVVVGAGRGVRHVHVKSHVSVGLELAVAVGVTRE